MDMHFETPSLTDVFLVTGKTPTPTLYGLTYIDHYPQASHSLFKLDDGTLSATMVDATIKIANFHAGTAVKVFDSPAAWKVTGTVQVPNSENWNTPAAFSGSLCVSLRCTATMARAVRVVSVAGDVPTSVSDDIVCINKTIGEATVVKLEMSPTRGRTVVISDCKGDADKNSITVIPSASEVDGAPTFLINRAWGSWEGYFNGTIWKTISSR